MRFTIEAAKVVERRGVEVRRLVLRGVDELRDQQVHFHVGLEESVGLEVGKTIEVCLRFIAMRYAHGKALVYGEIVGLTDWPNE